MSVIGVTDIGAGRFHYTLDHDPSSVATDGLRCSVAHNVSDDSIWLKLDDGVTTNWINLRNITSLAGGIAGGCMITQHAQTKPYSEVTSTSWTTLAALTFEGSNTYPISACYAVVSLSALGEGALRVQDVTNNNTVAEITWTDTTQHVEIDTTLTNVPTDLAVFEIQLRKISGGKPRLWSLQLK